MSDNHKYYYMRIKENFFDSDEIKLLESLPNVGYKYSNILLKMYLKSLKFNGKLMFNERIPFNEEMLSVVVGHSLNDVKDALSKFTSFGLIEKMSSGEIYMLDIQNFIGKTSTEADRIKAYRSKISNEKKHGVQMYDDCTPELELELELDIELKKDIDIDTEKDKNSDVDEKSVANKKQNSKEKYDLTSGYRKIVRLLEENGFGLVGGIVSQNISDELKDFAEKSDMDNAVAILEKAITIATLRNANNYGYVSKVTKNWYKDNLFTIDAVEATQKKSNVDKDNKNVYLKKQAKKDETNATRDLSSKRLNDFKKVVEIYTEMFGYVDMPVFGKHTPSNSNNEAWDKLLDGEKNTYDKLRGIVDQHVWWRIRIIISWRFDVIEWYSVINGWCINANETKWY